MVKKIESGNWIVDNLNSAMTTIESVGFLDSIPLWAITLLGSLFIWVLSLVMILTVYSRFFKLYMATAIAPIPLASFAGQPSSSIGVAFLKSYAAICLEGCVIVVACVIFSAFASAPPALACRTLRANRAAAVRSAQKPENQSRALRAVGIVGGRDKDGELRIIHCSSGYNNVVISETGEFAAVAKPVYYELRDNTGTRKYFQDSHS